MPSPALLHPLFSWWESSWLSVPFFPVCSLFPLHGWGLSPGRTDLYFFIDSFFWPQIFLLNCSLGCPYVFWFLQFSLICELIGTKGNGGSFVEGINTTSRSAEPRHAPVQHSLSFSCAVLQLASSTPVRSHTYMRAFCSGIHSILTRIYRV